MHPAELVAGIFQAFFQQRTWKQAELARRLGVRTERLREALEHLLETEAWPLERESDPPQTYWSVPADWFPGGVLVQSAQVPELLRVLKRAPRGKLRDAWLRRLARAASAGPDETEYVMREVSELEDRHLPVLDEAIQRGLAVHVTYFSANRGHVDERHITPHRILSGPPARVAATCHINDELRWFRVDRLQRAELDESTPARATDAEAVDRFVVHSIDGYAEGTQPVSCAFQVRDPDARWVKANLPLPMASAAITGGLRFSTETRAVRQLARFVLGLGGVASAETPELRRLVRELAEAALAATQD